MIQHVFLVTAVAINQPLEKMIALLVLLESTSHKRVYLFASHAFPVSTTIKRIKQSASLAWKENIVALTTQLISVSSVSSANRPSTEAPRAQHAFQEELVPHARSALQDNIVDPMTKLISVSNVSLVSRPSQKVQRARHAFLVVLASIHVKNASRENIVALTTKLTNVSTVPSVNTPPQEVQFAQAVIWASSEKLQASALGVQLENTTICEVPQLARRVLLAKLRTSCRVPAKDQHGS